MKCYIIPKEDYAEKQALLAVGYGAADTDFLCGGQMYKQPEGVAHFLEHKLFENKRVNVLDAFAKNSASANAYTNGTTTAYYFTCDDHFYENLALLTRFVAEPYFTDENVARERGIIGQEIAMYRDNPFWNLQFRLLDALYQNCPIKKNILGSERSIAEITADTLYHSYQTFYKPANMVLVCAGDFEPNEVFEKASELCQRADGASEPVERLYGSEPKAARKVFTSRKMQVARPMFSLGFKDGDFSGKYAERTVASRILLDVVAGESSAFFERLYERGVIDGPFALEYSGGNFYGTAVISNTCENPEEAALLLREAFADAGAKGLDERRFLQIRKKQLGRFVRGFNSLDGIVTGQADLHFKCASFQEILEAFEGIELEAVERRLKSLCRADNFALSVIKS